ncbi:unnamed protein product [Paramecium sonneborni]|uniref:Uncharacterized protein n=1 Tax=Paramecium sonneborni TaxID=65129 RepID=A0A8S1LEF8_9CILI|nr:unnamed protein product [Paramecium sonneborni]
MHTNTHFKIFSEIKIQEQSNNPTPTQFLSARTIRPSLFLNEDFHLPLISPQKKQATEYQIIKQTLPKSQAVSPVFRKTQTEEDVEDQFLFLKNTFRKSKKQKLFIKDHHQSHQFLPQIEDHSNKNAEYSTPKNYISTLNNITIESQPFHSPLTKQGTIVLNQEHPTQIIDYRISKEIAHPQQNHISSPEQINQTNNIHQPPQHKKTVSFRKSIIVIDINNGQVSKDQLSENAKPLQHIQKTEIKEEHHDDVKKKIFRKTRNFHLSDIQSEYHEH